MNIIDFDISSRDDYSMIIKHTFDTIVLPFEKLDYVGFSKLNGDVHCVYLEYKNVEIDDWDDVEVNLTEDLFMVTFFNYKEPTDDYKTIILNESEFLNFANRMTDIGKQFLNKNGL